MNNFEIPSFDKRRSAAKEELPKDTPIQENFIALDQSKISEVQEMTQKQAMKDDTKYLEILGKISKKESPQEKRILTILKEESGLSEEEIFRMREKIPFAEMVSVSEAILKNNKDVQASWTEDGLEKMTAALGTLAYKMRDSLGSYDLIVGDDSSGRLPALFLWKLAKQAQSKEAPDADVKLMFMAYRRPPTVAIPGNERDFSGNEWAEAVRERFSQDGIPKGKTLLVSEYSSTGGTINAFENALHSDDRKIDAAVLSVEKDTPAKLSQGGEVFFGANGTRRIGEYAFEHEQMKSTLRGRLFPRFFPNERPQQVKDRYDISGVQKTRNPNDTHAIRSESADADRMRVSREVMNAMAESVGVKLFP